MLHLQMSLVMLEVMFRNFLWHGNFHKYDDTRHYLHMIIPVLLRGWSHFNLYHQANKCPFIKVPSFQGASVLELSDPFAANKVS